MLKIKITHFYGLTLNDIPILAELGVFNRCQSIMDIKISLMDHPSLLRSAHQSLQEPFSDTQNDLNRQQICSLSAKVMHL